MKKSQFFSLGILLIAVTILIIIGAFKNSNKEPFIGMTTPSDNSTPVSLETPDPDKTALTPTATPKKIAVVFPVPDKNYIGSMSQELTSWYWGTDVDEDGVTYPVFNEDLKRFVDGFDYVFTNKGEGEKKISLTFNQGWDDPDQNTKGILDVLKDNNVKATFYLTKEYLFNENHHDLIRRMVNEGHDLGTRGPVSGSINTLSIDDGIKALLNMETKLQEILDDDTVRMTSFRPVEEFSRRDLALAQQLGYKIGLWSYNYNDWGEVTDKNAALARMKTYMLDGTVYAFSASNKANVELLPSLITEAKSRGFDFGKIG